MKLSIVPNNISSPTHSLCFSFQRSWLEQQNGKISLALVTLGFGVFGLDISPVKDGLDLGEETVGILAAAEDPLCCTYQARVSEAEELCFVWPGPGVDNCPTSGPTIRMQSMTAWLSWQLNMERTQNSTTPSDRHNFSEKL